MILKQGLLPLIEHRCDAPFEAECIRQHSKLDMSNYHQKIECFPQRFVLLIFRN